MMDIAQGVEYMDRRDVHLLDVSACFTSLYKVSSKMHGRGDSVELMPQELTVYCGSCICMVRLYIRKHVVETDYLCI